MFVRISYHQHFANCVLVGQFNTFFCPFPLQIGIWTQRLDDSCLTFFVPQFLNLKNGNPHMKVSQLTGMSVFITAEGVKAMNSHGESAVGELRLCSCPASSLGSSSATCEMHDSRQTSSSSYLTYQTKIPLTSRLL